MSPTIRSILIAIVCVGAIVVILVSQRKVTESEARQMAETRFGKVCRDFGLDRAAYIGPRITKVDGYPFEFEWSPVSIGTRDGIVVLVTDRGEMNVSFIPRPKVAPKGAPQ